MLDEIASERNSRVVFRVSSIPASDDQFLDQLNLDIAGREELMDFLSERISQNLIGEMLDRPFDPRRKFRPRTRFSDGTFPVFYSAFTIETAKAEVAYWFRNGYAGKPRKDRIAYFQSFHCRFEGLEKDLRSKVSDWPNLVHESDYSFCNQLGMEARGKGIDGLVVPSARHEGANMPIFVRHAISDPELEGTVRMTYSADSGEVSIDCLPPE
ncbi:MAG: RES family NAD+ phosphorylase [Bryobacterales bacterium]|nr:RES family NAD+ phosphorylase [Bryobacterales bacterium]